MKLCESIEIVEIDAWTKFAGIVPIYANILVHTGCSDVNESRKFWPKSMHIRRYRVNYGYQSVHQLNNVKYLNEGSNANIIILR